MFMIFKKRMLIQNIDIRTSDIQIAEEWSFSLFLYFFVL